MLVGPPFAANLESVIFWTYPKTGIDERIGDLAPTEAALTAIFGQVAEKLVFQELQDNRRLESKQVVIDHIEKSFDN